jgi:hypothetical protein
VIWSSVISQAQFNHTFIPIENLDALLKPCDNLSALDKLRIVLIWAKVMDKDCSRNEIQQIVNKYIDPTRNPTRSLDLEDTIELSEEFPGEFDIVASPSLILTIGKIAVG